MAPLTTSIRRQITVAARFSRYVAIGDSFTEGLMDFAADSEHTDPGDGFRGWADRLAEQLVTSPAGSPDLAYANLAIRGRLADQVLTEQLPRALELAPDLVSIVAGGNDCLRPYTDIDALAGEIESAVVRLREAGVEVLMATGYDTETASPLLRAVRSRVAIFNSHLWTIAQRHGCHMLDLWGLRDLYSSEMWADDRIHLSALGHELVSRQALATLEGTAATRRGFAMPERPGRPVRQAVAEETTWVRTHLAPWVSRRLRGVSSGDGLEPKLPTLTRVRGADGQDPGQD
ncbi:Lysophospholipase L1 [Brevibacterium sp. Mu109]|uniref:Lysophospholipase L1 n=2 Tax=Brevibacterium TaxID=1696 RepID=A0A2H1L461_9MICO|nr:MULTISPECIES: SGNH/GDSL hydrolase family protein [Brevibacterium]TWB98714.1 lysophospholipase L1-like esterase [Brevibacterium jeotgali]SLN00543.1 probable secreted protein [Brevibacterium yomogidense]SMX72793.1 Lysophospholipase L1 [Brevibacterium sp. Mu109]SMY11686.1 Lysophospholipase L1 [Brevibacterium jeotgali]